MALNGKTVFKICSKICIGESEPHLLCYLLNIWQLVGIGII